MFEFVVTATSLREVVDRGRRGYTQWVNDVGDTWLVKSVGPDIPKRRCSWMERSFRPKPHSSRSGPGSE